VVEGHSNEEKVESVKEEIIEIDAEMIEEEMIVTQEGEETMRMIGEEMTIGIAEMTDIVEMIEGMIEIDAIVTGKEVMIIIETVLAKIEVIEMRDVAQDPGQITESLRKKNLHLQDKPLRNEGR
jgi:hypothetical protein